MNTVDKRSVFILPFGGLSSSRMRFFVRTVYCYCVVSCLVGLSLLFFFFGFRWMSDSDVIRIGDNGDKTRTALTFQLKAKKINLVAETLASQWVYNVW